MMLFVNMYYHCVQRKDCGGCPFYNKETQKCLLNEEPKNYDIEKLQRAYAKMALMDFGEDLSDDRLY